MALIIRPRFSNELEAIVKFIAKDSYTNALKFRDEIFIKLKDLPNHPKAYRKSIKFDDESIRDLIYKGFVIPYSIEANGDILILGIYKSNIWKP